MILLAHGDKILKCMYDDSKPTFTGWYNWEQLSALCNTNKELLLPTLRHLANGDLISTRNKKGWVGISDIHEKDIYISSKGIRHVEEITSLPKKIRSWSPIAISITALIISIFALMK